MNGTEHKAIDAHDTVNSLVQRHPRALRVFRKFGIDTCCAGHLSLEVVAERHSLDLDALLADLRGMGAPGEVRANGIARD